MATPKSVARALQEAEALQAAIANQAAAPTDLVTDASQLAQPVEPATPAVPAEPPAPAPAPEETWEKRYKTLNGKYHAEVPALQSKVRTYESELAQVKEQVRALTQAKKQEPAKIDPKDIENFGADMIDMVRRHAKEVHEALRAEFDERIAALENSISGVSKKADVSIEQQFYATLTAMVPDWKEINTDDRWLEWLDETDPILGASRQAALNHAHQNLDAQRVAALFNLFKQQVKKPVRETLADQVAPSTSGAAPVASTPQPKRRISQAFVQKFYQDQMRGKYRGREAEEARIEQEINEAAAEGRIY